MIYLVTIFFAFLFTYLITPLVGTLGLLLRLADQPGGRRKHRGVIPRTGGVALFLGFFVTVLLILGLPLVTPASFLDWFPPRDDLSEMRRLSALLIGSGLCDCWSDRRSLRTGKSAPICDPNCSCFDCDQRVNLY
ncbi:MAG: hypothetical protein R2932_27965 [Caldilineaceae bacterium]